MKLAGPALMIRAKSGSKPVQLIACTLFIQFSDKMCSELAPCIITVFMPVAGS